MLLIFQGYKKQLVTSLFRASIHGSRNGVMIISTLRRGLEGIFLYDVNDYDQKMLLSECANSVVDAYIPIIEKRKDTFHGSKQDMATTPKGSICRIQLVIKHYYMDVRLQVDLL